ncbi:MAG TPA: hypothetical protein VN924_21920 [Bryobacteraceae bacterium]|jgi:hypothetical protein|nr:hypothetical protein [Bryobacteraceae bacterium]
MSLWKAVEDELATVETALAAVPPNVAEAQQLVAALALRVKNRQIPASRTFSVDELKKLSRLSGAATQAVQSPFSCIFDC